MSVSSEETWVVTSATSCLSPVNSPQSAAYMREASKSRSSLVGSFCRRAHIDWLERRTVGGSCEGRVAWVVLTAAALKAFATKGLFEEPWCWEVW